MTDHKQDRDALFASCRKALERAVATDGAGAILGVTTTDEKGRPESLAISIIEVSTTNHFLAIMGLLKGLKFDYERRSSGGDPLAELGLCVAEGMLKIGEELTKAYGVTSLRAH